MRSKQLQDFYNRLAAEIVNLDEFKSDKKQQNFNNETDKLFTNIQNFIDTSKNESQYHNLKTPALNNLQSNSIYIEDDQAIDWDYIQEDLLQWTNEFGSPDPENDPESLEEWGITDYKILYKIEDPFGYDYLIQLGDDKILFTSRDLGDSFIGPLSVLPKVLKELKKGAVPFKPKRLK
jgi:hypothetical protein